MHARDREQTPHRRLVHHGHADVTVQSSQIFAEPVEHRQRCEPLGVAGGAGEFGIDHQAVPVLHQHVPDEAELRLLAGPAPYS